MPKQTFFNLPTDKRQQIVDIAIDEFAANDYASVSISKIVARAGIAKGSFYQYFENKEDLSGYLITLIGNKKAEAFSLDHPDPEHVGLFNYMRWIFANSAEFELANPRLGQIGYRMIKEGSQNKLYAQAMESAQAYYKALVVLGKEQGDIAPDIDDEMAATIFRLLISEMGRYIVQQIVGAHGSDWQGRKAIFDFPEARQMFEQTLRVLEFGMGSDSAAQHETASKLIAVPPVERE